MTKKLFNEFPDVSAKAWKQKIQADLKGADYNDTLIWNTNDGIDVKPFYHTETFESLNNNTTIDSWNICQTIFVDNVAISNKLAINALSRGAESIKFIIPVKTISIKDLLGSVNAKSLYFECLFLDTDFNKSLQSFSSKQTTYICTDIIGNLARTGNWYNNFKDDHFQFTNSVSATSQFSIDSSLYQNAGANTIQQLAYSLAHCNEYLNHLHAEQLLTSNRSLIITFNVAIGSNFFFEIAKLRALRALVSTLANEYSIEIQTNIFTTPTKRNKTIYDYNTNMLRSTTECMSAILGNSNTICNLPYDAIYHKNNEFGDRISRNQLLILKHESYFNLVNNPSDGTYYIETLTKQLAEKALEIFKDIEAHGGFLSQLKEGIIQRKIKESAKKEQEQFNSGELVLVGSNKHPNSEDRMKDNLELYPFVKTNPRKTLIQPIIERRLAETLEQNRLKKE